MASGKPVRLGAKRPVSGLGHAAPPLVRCAVYTRKSSEEGLDQAFNSLHAQRDACEAYIASQKGEGWVVLPTAYDDGGHSGGSMARPALQRLLADVAAGRIDTVVVYKVDRLSRALADFARMVDLFDEQGCAFVSVTQAFSTTTSMGRLTLNMLLSFAQFEREVTGERIRDKIALSKAKGMWMGGLVPLGYDADGRTLKVNEPEADQVRALFQLYLAYRSVDQVVQAAAAHGIRSKPRTRRDGTAAGDAPLGRAAVYRILANRVYLGEIVHKRQVHPGQHAGVVAPDLFQAAQALLAAQRRKRAGQGTTTATALLTGRLFSANGDRLTPTHTRRGQRRYGYYAGGGMRVAQARLDALVVDTLLDHLANPAKLAGLLPDAQLVTGERLQAGASLATRLQRSATRTDAVHALVVEVCVQPTQTVLTLDLGALGVSGHSSMLAVQGTVGSDKARIAICLPGPATPKPDAGLVALVAQARDWFARLTRGTSPSISALAREDGLSEAYVRQLLPAAFLAPDLVTAIVQGTHPRPLTVARLKQLLPLPADWAAQRALVAQLEMAG